MPPQLQDSNMSTSPSSVPSSAASRDDRGQESPSGRSREVLDKSSFVARGVGVGGGRAPLPLGSDDDGDDEVLEAPPRGEAGPSSSSESSSPEQSSAMAGPSSSSSPGQSVTAGGDSPVVVDPARKNNLPPQSSSEQSTSTTSDGAAKTSPSTPLPRNVGSIGGGVVVDEEGEAKIDEQDLKAKTASPKQQRSRSSPPSSPTSKASPSQSPSRTDGGKGSGSGSGNAPASPSPSEALSNFTSPASLLPSSGGGSGSSYHEDVDRTDRQFKMAAAIGTSAWLLLAAVTYRLAPSESFEYVPSVERNACAFAFAILLVSNVSRIVPLVYSRRERAFSGVIWGSIAVQSIALLTDAMLAFLPTPVLIDPITKGRVHLIRWCEWAPVAGIMTFMTEGVDLPHPQHGRRIGLYHALAQSLSTFCGLLFPLCPNGYVWGITMLVSCLLYFVIFVRLREKWTALKRTERGQTVEEQEMHDRVRLSFRLLAACAFMWTLLVMLYFVGWMAPLYSSPDSLWHSPALPMLTETFCEVWSKVLYLLIVVDVHSAVFDEGTRAERRLAELRRMMGAVWESSSDVITISVRSVRDGTVTTMVSPTFPKLERELLANGGRGRGRRESGASASADDTTSGGDAARKETDAGGDGDGDAFDLKNNPCALVFELTARDFEMNAGKKEGERIVVNPRKVHYVPLQREEPRSSSASASASAAASSSPPSASSSSSESSSSSSDGEKAGDDDAAKAKAKAAKAKTAKAKSAHPTPVPVSASSRPAVYALSELLVLAWNGEQQNNAAAAAGDDDGEGKKAGKSASPVEAKKERLVMHDFKSADFGETNLKRRSFAAAACAPDEHADADADAGGAGSDSDGNDDAEPNSDDSTTVRCEAKVTRIETHALLMVVRDISERFRRFEAEKRVVVEKTARQKDAEANRFTRHEVKNGLLAAIGLCDSLREAFDDTGAGGDKGADGSGSGGKGASEATHGRQESDASSTSKLDPQSVADMLSSASNAWQRKLQDSSGRRTVEFDVRRCMSELDATLKEVLDTVLAQSMARDVVHEIYQPKAEKVDLRTALYGVRGCSGSVPDSKQQGQQQIGGGGGGGGGGGRFPLVTYPSPLPLFVIDPHLLRFIHRNAISNAVKYGKAGGRVLTEVKFDPTSASPQFQMEVINSPGEYHAQLRRMGPRAEAEVFAPGRRLHPQFGGGTTNLISRQNDQETIHSSGDGAWIMRKCAEALGGTCSIRFEEDRTVFRLRCPARPVESRPNGEVPFRLPSNVWGVAIDDSKIQRKLLERIFHLIGIDRGRTVVLGKDADEITGFDSTVLRTMRDHPRDYMLVIADENLDVVVEKTRHTTVSGSGSVRRIRDGLSAEEERRLLALVRSANDSADELEVYTARAHGFLPKAPIQRDKVMDLIAPLWVERFGEYNPGGGSGGGRGSSSSSTSADAAAAAAASTEYDALHLHVSSADLMQTLEVIDALCLARAAADPTSTSLGVGGDPSDALSTRWPVIWEKLHVLKGDLKTLKDSVRVTAVLEAIDRLQGTEYPADFVERWRLIRSLVVSLM